MVHVHDYMYMYKQLCMYCTLVYIIFRREESLCLQQYCSSIIGNSTECLKLSLATLENRTTENYTEVSFTHY